MLPIVVISLADAVERREHARRELEQQGLAFEVFDALNAETGRERFARIDVNEFVLHTGRLPTHGEIGCFASHKALWQRCADEGRPLLVMEDDFSLQPAFSAAVRAAGEIVGILGLLRLQDERRGASRTVMPYRGFRVERYTKPPHCTMCYALSPKIARRLIDLHRDLRAPVDVVMKQVWQYDNPMYCLTPYTVSDSDLSGGSTIGARCKCDRDPVTRLRRSWLKIGWQWQRLGFNLRQRDDLVRERLSGRRGLPRVATGRQREA